MCARCLRARVAGRRSRRFVRDVSAPSRESTSPAAESVTDQIAGTSWGPSVRREDLPLHEDVRWLAGGLGRVIRQQEGEEAFETVERLRGSCRAGRPGAPGA